ALRRAAQAGASGALLLDAKKQTAELTDAAMLLDVGAIAKGYATELLARELEQAGLLCFAVSSGGNIRAHGAPPGTAGWRIGIQNPDEALLGEAPSLAGVVIRDGAVATSGDYQRFFIKNGKRIHHLIDPATLWPADRCRAVTVVAADAALADLLSTALFVLGPDEGEPLARQCGAAAFWVLPDGAIRCNPAMEALLMQSKTPSKRKVTAQA
ncbi:MAG: FAD:protein FMN transferase, partial [Oscillospiraceae bacterium]